MSDGREERGESQLISANNVCIKYHTVMQCRIANPPPPRPPFHLPPSSLMFQLFLTTSQFFLLVFFLFSFSFFSLLTCFFFFLKNIILDYLFERFDNIRKQWVLWYEEITTMNNPIKRRQKKNPVWAVCRHWSTAHQYQLEFRILMDVTLSQLLQTFFHFFFFFY